MSSKRMFFATAVSLFALLAAVGVAWAASAPSSGKSGSATAGATIRVSAFKRAFHPTRSQLRERNAIRRLVRRSSHRAIAASTDISRARPTPIAGGDGDVWIAPAAAGSVCTFIADPIDGYASSCATEDDISAGAAVTMLGGGTVGPLSDSAIVAVVVPDGADAPTLSDPAGDTSVMPVQLNTSAELVPIGSTVHSGLIDVQVPGHTAPTCAPVRPGETFRRCQF